MTDHDRTSGSTRNRLSDADIYLTREYVEHALYQFPSAEERVLLTRPRPPRDEGADGAASHVFFERHRARWSARAQEEPDLSVLLVKPDRQGRRRALGAAAAVALGASVLALVTRSPLLVSSSPRPFHVSEMSARQRPLATTIDRSVASRAAEGASSALASGTPARSPVTLQMSARTRERVQVSRAIAMPTTDLPGPQPAVAPDTPTPARPDPPSSIVVNASTAPIDRGDVRLEAAPGRAPESHPTPELTATGDVRPGSAPSNAAADATTIDERQMIHQVLGQYAAAFTQLDATAARAVWPQVDRRALERGFSQLERQTVVLNNCTVSVRASQATAHCRGQATYVPKVGNRSERTETRTWQFELRKSGDGWIIARVESR